MDRRRRDAAQFLHKMIYNVELLDKRGNMGNNQKESKQDKLLKREMETDYWREQNPHGTIR